MLVLLLSAWLVGPAAAAVNDGAPRLFVHTDASSAADKTLLWKVERSGLRPSYVFGTIHSEDTRVAELSASVIQAFRSANAYAMEMIPDQAALAYLSNQMFITNGPNLRQLLGEEWFARTAELTAASGVPEALLPSLKPWVVFMSLTTPRAQNGLFLEVILYSAALQDGKYVHGLETADEQINAFDAIPLEDQLTMIKELVANHHNIPARNRALADSYARGDLTAIATMQAQYAPSDDARLADLFYKRTVDDRNLRMVDRIVPRIEEENAFIAIDAWHLPGENGVLQLLKERGYVVSPIR